MPDFALRLINFLSILRFDSTTKFHSRLNDPRVTLRLTCPIRKYANTALSAAAAPRGQIKIPSDRQAISSQGKSEQLPRSARASAVAGMLCWQRGFASPVLQAFRESIQSICSYFTNTQPTHPTKSPETVVIEVHHQFDRFHDLVGQHVWSEFLIDPTKEDMGKSSTVLYSSFNTGRLFRGGSFSYLYSDFSLTFRRLDTCRDRGTLVSRVVSRQPLQLPVSFDNISPSCVHHSPP